MKTKFKRKLNEALPNFVTNKPFLVLAQNATEEYALLRAQELIAEAMQASDDVLYNDRILRAIQLLVIARIRHEEKEV